GHGRDVQLAARADDTQRDLAAIGDQDFLEQGGPGYSRDIQSLPLAPGLAGVPVVLEPSTASIGCQVRSEVAAMPLSLSASSLGLLQFRSASSSVISPSRSSA